MTPVEIVEYYTATKYNGWTGIVMPSANISSSGAYFDEPRIWIMVLQP